MNDKAKPYWNPYLAGVVLGLVLLTSFLVMGKGLGASGGVYRVGVSAIDTVAPAHVQSGAYLQSAVADGSALHNFYVFMLGGVFLGGLVSSFAAGRFGVKIVRGPRIDAPTRIALAISGGILMGFAARFARGCTSGQALSGGALLSVGSWIFMMAVFAGGYALAYFLRRQWT
jgi:hypothetical protein